MSRIEELSRRIGEVAKDTGQTIAVAESLTAGKVQDALASVSGASGYFSGGLTAYNIEQKVKHLGVDRGLAEVCNCVSATVAYQMAEGVRRLFNSDIGVSTTGYAEPPSERANSYAFFCVLVGTASGQGMVEGEGLTREQMRLKVVEEALETVALMVGALEAPAEE